MKIKPLADPAIEAVESGKTRFIPPNWANTYFEWMRNIRDWCISRQLWWGHRIPAWYCSCGEIIVEKTEPKKCPKCGSAELRQDSDVLDTWFSSGLWPFSTLGWPEKTADLKAFYPGSVLITGYDIIFFWVARMMMFGLKFMNDVPFRAVYITGHHSGCSAPEDVQVEGQCRRSARTLRQIRNGRCSLRVRSDGRSWNRYCPLTDDLLESYRNFATKIWNAARFMLRYVEDGDRVPSLRRAEADGPFAGGSLDSRPPLPRSAGGQRSLEQYNLHEASRTIYRFFWHEFCDWYLEMIKLHPERSKPVLLYVFESALRMLHPFMPFLTEELWQTIPHEGESIVIAAVSGSSIRRFADSEAESQTEMIQDVIVKVRNIRSEMGVDAKQAVRGANGDGRSEYRKASDRRARLYLQAWRL